MDNDGQWLENLYHETGPHLLFYLGRRLGNEDAAKDLLQETFAAALRHPERFQTAISPRAYLFGIARNLVASAARKFRETEPVPMDLAVEENYDDPRLEALREAIARLKEDFREVLEMRLQYEMSYEEIAAALDIPVGTVRSRLHHAVNQLRRVMRYVDADLSVPEEEL